MMTKFGLLALAASLLIAVTACDTTTSPDEPKVAPNAPTGLAATSIDATTIGLKWVSSPTGAAPTGYVISILEDGTTTPTTLNVSSGSTVSANIAGLTEGKLYTFTVRAANDTALSVPSASVTWAPAKRHTGTFKLYSSKSKTFGSGLSLKDGQVLKIADGARWEFCYDDKDGRPLVGSPGVSGYTLPSGEFLIVSMDTNTTHYARANSLDDVYDVRALDNGANFTENLVDLSTLPNPSTGVVLIMRSRLDASTVNFAKVLVKPNAAGTGFVNGTGDESYVEVEVSYQTVANVPYAAMEKYFGGARGGSNARQ
ncbi:MAG: fibronectin type III domain-containing protein [Bradyrhizobiaceae bacterium]|nr:fibronectin type III domain-containing protein [Bradyrhizobiaceae bacterium]